MASKRGRPRKTITIEDLQKMNVVLSPEEAAKVLKMGRSSIYPMLITGKIPGAYQVGSYWKIPLSGVAQLLGFPVELLLKDDNVYEGAKQKAKWSRIE